MNAPNTPYRPILTDSARPATFVVASVDENGQPRDVSVAGEHPLTIYVDKQELVTLMTLGGAPEALAIGYLRNQRLVPIRSTTSSSVQVDWECNACAITTRHGLADLEAKTARRTKTTGCGQGTVFGDLMDEIDSVRLPDGARLTQSALYDLLDRVRVHETIYKQAGAVHGCALAANEDDTAPILMFVEDVGRHNAVDAIAGRMWLDRHGRRRQDLLHDGPPDVRDGDQGGADGHPVPRVAVGPDADGLRDRAEGRRHDDRPRDEQALPAVHRRAAVRAMNLRAPRPAPRPARGERVPGGRVRGGRASTSTRRDAT